MNFLYYSNQSENLRSKLAELISEPVLPPFQKELILIQTHAMEKSLSLSIAKENGICSGINFLFPARFLKELLSLKLAAPFPFDPKQTGWLIWKLLSSPAFDRTPLPPFIQEIFKQRSGLGSVESLRQYYFSCHLAHLFDRYLLYHPGWSFGEKEESDSSRSKENDKLLEDWQGYIWGALCKEYPDLDLKSRILDFFTRERERERERERQKKGQAVSFLPPRIFIFCIPFLAPLIERLLLELSKDSFLKLDIHWFFLEAGPSSLYEKKKARNSLLSHYDKFQDRLSNHIATHIKTEAIKRKEREIGILDLCQQPEEKTLLKDIQRALYHDSDTKEKGEKRFPSLLFDSSLSIQSCHSPLREVEVLHDWLIRQFEKNPKLALEDVLILCPKLEVYAPFIESVFSRAGEKEAPFLAYNLRTPVKKDDLSFARMFFTLMQIGEIRFEAKQVFHILSDPLIAKRAGFSFEDLKVIRKYMKASSICWALDAAHRARYDIEAQDRHTFKEGLLRLFYSFACGPSPSSSPSLSALGIAELDPPLNIEGQNAMILGNFADILEDLSFYAEKLQGSYRLSEWAQILSEMEELFLGTKKTEALLESLREIEREGKFTEPITLAPAQIYLEQCQSELAEKGAFSAHAPGIQCMDLSSARALSYPVICFLGMNEGDFPRREKSYEFDLLESKEYAPPKQSCQDRLFFLELLLCAKSQLYISYIGQSQHRPDESFAPSLLLSELESYIKGRYALSDEGLKAFSGLVQKHPMHGFSEAYFSSAKKEEEKERLFSYAIENYKAAQSLHKAGIAKTSGAKAFQNAFLQEDTRITEKNPEGKTEEARIEFQALLDFFGNPAKAWVQKNLELSLPSSPFSEELPQEEPLELSSLERYKLCMEISRAMLASKETEKEAGITKAKDFDMKAQAVLPHGNYGDLLKEKLWEDSLAFIETARKYSKSRILRPFKRDFSLRLSGAQKKAFTLSGTLEASLNEEGDLVFFDYGRRKGAKQLKVWIQYIIFYLISHEEGQREKNRKAYFVFRDQYLEYDLGLVSLSLASEYLSELCSLYLNGMKKLICYFSESSWSYASTMIEEKKKMEAGEALRRAQGDAKKKWYGDMYREGEAENPYISLCFRERDPFLKEERVLYEEFQKLSLKVWEPVLKHSKASKI